MSDKLPTIKELDESSVSEQVWSNVNDNGGGTIFLYEGKFVLVCATQCREYVDGVFNTLEDAKAQLLKYT